MKVSILLPHYKTTEMVQLCLQSLRSYTDPGHEVIVIDNGSGDHPSLDYLRSQQWIKLIVIDPSEVNADGALAHKDALQAGLEAASNRYIVSLHTDAFVLKENWLEWMLQPMQQDSKVGAVGTYKLEYQPYWYQLMADIKTRFRASKDASVSKAAYVRSHCALYDREIMDAIGLGFISNQTAGRELYFTMLEQGYRTRLLPVTTMSKYVAHINHATMVLNPEFDIRKKSVSAGEQRIRNFLASEHVQKIRQRNFDS